LRSAAVTDQQIAEVLDNIGMKKPGDELNCGACGYDACRELATAVVEGRAEVEMCMPAMRRQAHRISLMLHHTANGVLLVNHDLKIEFANPAFRKMFCCKNDLLRGRAVAEVLDNTVFETALAAGGSHSIRAEWPGHDLIYQVQIFPIEGESLMAAIFVDVTHEAHTSREFRRVREATLQQAQEVIARQMKTAQEIAGLLGETTAETKALLIKLMNLARRETEE
jgi:uncharacterized Fe-S cluster-containing protein